MLEQNGRCWGTVTKVFSARRDSYLYTSQKYELPPEVFDECKALLQKTDFFRMRRWSAPEALFENSATFIKVPVPGNGRNPRKVAARRTTVCPGTFGNSIVTGPE